MTLGIDPGWKEGAIVAMGDDGSIVDEIKTKSTDHDLNAFIRKYRDQVTMAAIEKVWARPGQSATSMEKLIDSAASIRGMLIANDIPFDKVPATKWQKHFGLKGKGNSKTEHKNILKGHAQQLYPNHKIFLWNADAILIARYCWEKTK